MAINHIDFEDSGKTLKVIIDGYKNEIPVKTIKKKDSTITINQLHDTALNEDIIVDATLSPAEKGVLTFSVWSLDRKIQYYSADVSSQNNHFVHKIPNNFKVGEYIITIKYNGNKYYKEKEESKQIKIKKREIVCHFESRVFYAFPNSTLDINFKLIDKNNFQSIKNCQFYYLYNGETFNISSDSNGNVNLNFLTANTDETHCRNDTVIYTIWFYLKDSESYYLADNSIKIIIKPLSTYISAKRIIEDDNQFIKGNVLTDNGHANHGIVTVFFANGASLPKKIDIDNTGDFKIKITDKDILTNLYSNHTTPYTVSPKIYTSLSLSADENIKVGEEIQVTAQVTDEKNKIVTDGVVDFKLYNNINKEVYRYVDELNDNGEVLFIFPTSKIGQYRITASYSSIITYESLENQEITIEVQQGE